VCCEVKKVEKLLYKETFLTPAEGILVYSLKVFCTNITRAKKNGLKKH
jgi:hypothetical protein